MSDAVKFTFAGKPRIKTQSLSSKKLSLAEGIVYNFLRKISGKLQPLATMICERSATQNGNTGL